MLIQTTNILALVTTNARDNRVEDQISLAPMQRILRVWVTETPEHGHANAAVEDLVAHHLGIAPTLVTVVRGHRGRRKLLAVRR